VAEVKKVSVRITAEGVEDAQLKIGRVSAAADELGAKHPTVKPEIDSARALLEMQLLKQGIRKELAGALNVEPSFLSKALGFAGGTGGSGLSGALSGTPAVGGLLGQTGVYGLVAVAAAAAAALVEVDALAAGFTAAGLGLGAFGLLALPTLDKIKNAYAGVQTAQQGVTSAQKTYTDAVEKNKLDPTKANAAAVAAALLKVKVAQEDLAKTSQGPGGVIAGLDRLKAQFDKLAAPFQPVVLTVINEGLKIASQLLPVAAQFAKAAAPAIEQVLKSLSKDISSQGFQNFVNYMLKLTPGAIEAIGKGILQVAGAVGHLLTVLSAKDVINGINFAFTTIAGVINGLAYAVGIFAKTWDYTWHAIEAVFLYQAYLIIHAAAAAFGWIPGLGPQLTEAAHNFDVFEAHVLGNMSGIRGAAALTTGAFSQLAGAAGAAAAAAAAAASGVTINQPHQNKTRQYASGGVVAAAGWSLVGENGPELVRMPAGATVYPAGPSAGMLGGSTYNIYLPPTMVNPAEAGRVIVTAIRAYEQGSGKSWRKT
jgi:hypothetical protein